MAMLPLALYVHFPWCVRKCPYCDFNSHALKGELPDDAYVDALLRDLDFELARLPDTPALVSIFLGGGTPSLFPGGAIGRLLEGAALRIAFAPGIEITLEANPGTADAANFRGYRAAGVNRLSIGVQSLHAPHLRALGRIHDPDQARAALHMARGAGFDNVNLDLMYGLPGQSLEQAMADLDAAMALEPEHLSWYQLTIEPQTEFHAQPPALPAHDDTATMQDQGLVRLAAAGFAQYEVSAHAQAGRQCRHNRNYWEFGDYLGIGAGAHGKRSRAAAAELEVTRRARHRQPARFLATAGTAEAVAETRGVAAAELPLEYMMNALRLNEGFAIDAFTQRTGLAPAALEPGLDRAQARGLVERAAGRVQPTALGRRHLNALVGEFL